MNTDEHGLVLEEETGAIISCSFEVLNTLGHGLREKPYENALAVEFRLRGITYKQQPVYEVRYKDILVGEYIPDLIVFDQVIVDTKVIDCISDIEIGQMMNYLKITGLRVGMILNFKSAKLKWKRIII